MPRPSSISSPPSSKPGRPAAGTVQGDSATPMVRTASAAARASAATARRSAPASAAAPATLWTRTVPASPRRPAWSADVGQGDVVGDDHHLDRDALGPGHLGGQAEVEAVAGVVLDDQQAARRAGDGADGGQDGVGGGRGEDVAGDRGREHAAADVAGVGRLVPAAAAGDQGHPAASGLLGVVADQDVCGRAAGEARGRRRPAPRPSPRRPPPVG